MSKISVFFDDEQLQYLMECNKKGISKSFILRTALQEYMDKQKEKPVIITPSDTVKQQIYS
jgi:hypothetical protein